MATLVRRDSRFFFGEMMRNASLDAVAGLWLFASAFFLPATYLFFVNNLAAGGIVAIIAFFGPFANPRFAWIPAALGLWTAISPIALDFTEFLGATWNNVIVGLLIVVLSLRSWTAGKNARDAGMLPDRGQ